MNIAYIAKENDENKITFSEKGTKELMAVGEATGHIIDMSFDSFNNDKESEAFKVQPLAKAIDEMTDVVESHHIERLQAGDCGVAGGVALYDIMNSFERIAIHSKAISKHVMKRMSGDMSLDALHGHLTDKKSEEYQALEKYYYERYIVPVSKDDKKKEEVKKAEKAKEESKKTDKVKDVSKKPEKTKEEIKKSDKSKEENKKPEKKKEDKKDEKKKADKNKK